MKFLINFLPESPPTVGGGVEIIKWTTNKFKFKQQYFTKFTSFLISWDRGAREGDASEDRPTKKSITLIVRRWWTGFFNLQKTLVLLSPYSNNPPSG